MNSKRWGAACRTLVTGSRLVARDPPSQERLGDARGAPIARDQLLTLEVVERALDRRRRRQPVATAGVRRERAAGLAGERLEHQPLRRGRALPHQAEVSVLRAEHLG